MLGTAITKEVSHRGRDLGFLSALAAWPTPSPNASDDPSNVPVNGDRCWHSTSGEREDRLTVGAKARHLVAAARDGSGRIDESLAALRPQAEMPDETPDVCRIRCCELLCDRVEMDQVCPHRRRRLRLCLLQEDLSHRELVSRARRAPWQVAGDGLGPPSVQRCGDGPHRFGADRDTQPVTLARCRRTADVAPVIRAHWELSDGHGHEQS